MLIQMYVRLTKNVARLCLTSYASKHINKQKRVSHLFVPSQLHLRLKNGTKEPECSIQRLIRTGGGFVGEITRRLSNCQGFSRQHIDLTSNITMPKGFLTQQGPPPIETKVCANASYNVIWYNII